MATAAREPRPTRADTLAAHQERVTRAVVFIEDHLDADLSLESLSRRAHMSPFHFHRVFTRLVGESPASYVRRLRIESAARRLATGPVPLDALWPDAGFSGPEPFVRAFRRALRAPPAAWGARAARPRRTPRPPGLHGWVNRPGRDGQLRFRPARATPGRLPIRVDRLWPVRIAFVRCTGPRPAWPGALRRVVEWGQARGRVGETPVCVLVHHDDPRITPAARRRLDCGVVVLGRTRPEGDIGVRTVGGWDVAVTSSPGRAAAAGAAQAWIESCVAGALGRPAAPGVRLHIPLACPWTTREPGFDVLVPLGPPAGPVAEGRGVNNGRMYFVRTRWEWGHGRAGGDDGAGAETWG